MPSATSSTAHERVSASRAALDAPQWAAPGLGRWPPVLEMLTARVRERSRRDVGDAERFVGARRSDDDVLGGQAEFPLDPLV